MASYTIKSSCPTSASEYATQRKFARTSNGHLHTVYYRSDGSYNQIYYAVSIDGGETWTETAITSESYNQYSPSIAVDSNNYIHIVWRGAYSGSTTYSQIRYIQYTTYWQTIVNLTSESYNQYVPVIAIDGLDYIYIAWYGQHAGSTTYSQIRFIRYTTSWQSIEAITTGSYNQLYPSIAIQKDGGSYYINLVWHGTHSGSTSNNQIRYRKYTTSWQTIVNLTTATTYPQNCPSISIDSNNYINVVWYGTHSGSTTYSQIRYIQYTTSWQTIVNLTSESYSQLYPSVSTDTNNYIHVVWQGRHSGSTTYNQIRYIVYTTSWQSITDITSSSIDQKNANIIWANFPRTLSGLQTNKFDSGYSFIWNDDTTVKFYASSNLIWDRDTDIKNILGFTYSSIKKIAGINTSVVKKICGQ